MADIMIKLTLLKKHPNLLKNNNEVNEQAKIKGRKEKKKKKKKWDFQKILVYLEENFFFFFSQLRYFS